MVSDWQTNTVLLSDRLPERHPTFFRELIAILKEHSVRWQIVEGTADIWIRDYAPAQVTRDEVVQFRYEPDYLRGYPGLRTGPEVIRRVVGFSKIEDSDIVLDGGNLVSDGRTVILTDKVFSENQGRSPSELTGELQRLLRCEQVIVIPTEADDVIGHADGMLRFVAPGKVVVNDYRRVDSALAKRLQAALSQGGLFVECLPYCPSRRVQDGIGSAVGNYVNFLRAGDLVVVPQYGLAADAEASSRLRRLLPTCKVVPLRCRSLAEEGGVLNCITATVRTGPSRSLGSLG
jgi:agmatine deiminase